MIIANPIYDAVFKHLMANRHSAKFFIETLIGEKIEDIAMVPKEYTYFANVKKENEQIEKDEIERSKTKWEILSIMRNDFVATIRNADGERKKVIIEIQKSSKPADLMRFRTYLSEQYKQRDVVEVASGKVEKALPIICIYLLGFKLTNIKAAAIRVCRTYTDMIGQTEIKQRNKWIEALTHDGYFVQIPYITGKPRTLLESVLSVFEQQYFFDDKNTIKEYDYPIEDNNLKKMVEILKYAASDPKTRREMEEAWWAEENEKEYERVENELKKTVKAFEETTMALEEKKKALEETTNAYEETTKAYEETTKAYEETTMALEEKTKAYEEKTKAYEETTKAYEETTKAYEETTKAYEESKKSLTEKDKSLAEKDKSLAEKEKSLAEKEKSLAEKDKEIEELKKQLGR